MNQVVTKVFKNGNSQAVRIPAEFRLNTDQVRIFKNEQGDLVIQALDMPRGDALLAALSAVDDEFVTIMEDIVAESQADNILNLPEREDF